MGGVSSIQFYFGFLENVKLYDALWELSLDEAEQLLWKLTQYWFRIKNVIGSLTARCVAERPFTVHCDVLFRRISRFMIQLSPSALNLQQGEIFHWTEFNMYTSALYLKQVIYQASARPPTRTLQHTCFRMHAHFQILSCHVPLLKLLKVNYMTSSEKNTGNCIYVHPNQNGVFST